MYVLSSIWIVFPHRLLLTFSEIHCQYWHRRTSTCTVLVAAQLNRVKSAQHSSTMRRLEYLFTYNTNRIIHNIV